MSVITQIASLLWFVFIAVAIVVSIRAVLNQCSECLRQIPRGETTCPACGAAVEGRSRSAKPSARVDTGLRSSSEPAALEKGPQGFETSQ
jgi:predicted amidophosphoribosyltransferase